MALSSSGVLDPLAAAEYRFGSSRTRTLLPPLLTSDILTSDAATPTKQTPRPRGAYPRKRAVRACQTCRARRTKCDNKKPSCSFCERIGAKCVVNDPADLSAYGIPPLIQIEKLPQTIATNCRYRFDPASLVIIQRLDQLELLIQQQKETEPAKPPPVDQHAIDLKTRRRASSGVAVANGDTTSLIGSPLYYSSDLSRLTIETILSWNVFEGKYDSNTDLKALVTSPTTLSGEPFLANSDPRLERLDLDLDVCTRLLHTFLEHVHIANPILDVPLVTNYLYQACVHGIGWDAPSCLVVSPLVLDHGWNYCTI